MRNSECGICSVSLPFFTPHSAFGILHFNCPALSLTVRWGGGYDHLRRERKKRRFSAEEA